MPRNDQSDSLSVRGADDPRRIMKGMQQETELELGSSEARDTGGVEHQSAEDRAGIGRERRPVEQATRRMAEVDRDQAAARDAPGRSKAIGDAAASGPERERGQGPRTKR